jgi:hypothetical protein
MYVLDPSYLLHRRGHSVDLGMYRNIPEKTCSPLVRSNEYFGKIKGYNYATRQSEWLDKSESLLAHRDRGLMRTGLRSQILIISWIF